MTVEAVVVAVAEVPKVEMKDAFLTGSLLPWGDDDLSLTLLAGLGVGQLLLLVLGFCC